MRAWARIRLLSLFLPLLLAPAAAQTTLRIGLAEDPLILDPTIGRTYVGRIVFASLCDKLFDIDEKLNVVPQLALSHETAEDGRSVLIRLRPGVKFHDGEPLDAEAAKYSLDRHLTMPGSFRRPEISQIDTIDVVDPLTIRLNLKSPFAPLIAQLTDRAGMMVSPKAAKEAGDKFGNRPICAGPYKFVERVQQDRVVVERFADYWDRANVHIDRIVYLPIADSTVRLANLRSGQLDLIERPLATDLRSIRATAGLKVATAFELGYQGLTINVGKGEAAKGPLGADARIRRALEWSIDREAINQVIFNGEFKPGNQWVSPLHPFYQQSFPVLGRDVAKAKALIAEAGARVPILVDLMIPNNPEQRQLGELIQAMAGEAGFDIKLRTVEFATSLTEAQEGRFQAYLSAWSGRTDIDGNVMSFISSRAPNNYSFYSNAETDAALIEARTKTDPAARKAAYQKATAAVQRDLPIIYLYHRVIITAYRDRLEGYRPMPDGLIRVVGLKLK